MEGNNALMLYGGAAATLLAVAGASASAARSVHEGTTTEKFLKKTGFRLLEATALAGSEFFVFGAGFIIGEEEAGK